MIPGSRSHRLSCGRLPAEGRVGSGMCNHDFHFTGSSRGHRRRIVGAHRLDAAGRRRRAGCSTRKGLIAWRPRRFAAQAGIRFQSGPARPLPSGPPAEGIEGSRCRSPRRCAGGHRRVCRPQRPAAYAARGIGVFAHNGSAGVSGKVRVGALSLPAGGDRCGRHPARDACLVARIAPGGRGRSSACANARPGNVVHERPRPPERRRGHRAAPVGNRRFRAVRRRRLALDRRRSPTRGGSERRPNHAGARRRLRSSDRRLGWWRRCGLRTGRRCAPRQSSSREVRQTSTRSPAPGSPWHFRHRSGLRRWMSPCGRCRIRWRPPHTAWMRRSISRFTRRSPLWHRPRGQPFTCRSTCVPAKSPGPRRSVNSRP